MSEARLIERLTLEQSEHVKTSLVKTMSAEDLVQILERNSRLLKALNDGHSLRVPIGCPQCMDAVACESCGWTLAAMSCGVVFEEDDPGSICCHVHFGGATYHTVTSSLLTVWVTYQREGASVAVSCNPIPDEVLRVRSFLQAHVDWAQGELDRRHHLE